MNRIAHLIRLFVTGVCIALGACLAGCREDAATGAAMAASLARVPSMQVLVDASSSSPAFDQALMDSVAPRIAAAVKTLPIGSWVSVNTVGDATVPVSLLRLQIQARGNTSGDVARQLQRFLRDFPAQAKAKAQGRSELIGGFAAAAPLINRQSDANLIYVVSDLVEYSDVANCITARVCTLPATPGFDLAGAKVHVYGVGQGLPAGRAMQLTAAWQRFLAKANAPDAELLRF